MKFIFNIETVILFNITIYTPKYEEFDWLDMSTYFPYFLREDVKYWEKNSIVSRKWRLLFKFFKKVIYKLLLLYYLNFSERQNNSNMFNKSLIRVSFDVEMYLQRVI